MPEKDYTFTTICMILFFSFIAMFIALYSEITRMDATCASYGFDSTGDEERIGSINYVHCFRYDNTTNVIEEKVFPVQSKDDFDKWIETSLDKNRRNLND